MMRVWRLSLCRVHWA